MLYYVFSAHYALYMTEKIYTDILRGWGVLVGEAKNCQPFVSSQSDQRKANRKIHTGGVGPWGRLCERL